jgi:hypothetical protein
MLVNSDGNYLNPSSWTKLTTPVFSTVVSTNGSVYGPGHCGFTKSLDGTQDWIIYHAAKYSGSGWDRNIRMQPFSWTTDGYPQFGQPVPAGAALSVPSGDAFTPARFGTVTAPPDGPLRLVASAPLPLVTNQWGLEFSGDLVRWSGVTNISGLQFLIDYTNSLSASNGFFRIQTTR